MSLEVVLGVLWLIACLTVLTLRGQDQPVLPTQLQDQTAADEVIANVGPIGTSARLASVRSFWLRHRWQLLVSDRTPWHLLDCAVRGVEHAVPVGGMLTRSQRLCC